MNANAYTFEYKPSRKDVPEHIYPWLYDFENPIQRKRFPVKTMLEMDVEIKRIEALLKQAEKSTLGGHSCLAPCVSRLKYREESNIFKQIPLPVQIQIGDRDMVVSNDKAKRVFNRLDPKRRELVVHEGLDHGPFSDN